MYPLKLQKLRPKQPNIPSIEGYKVDIIKAAKNGAKEAIIYLVLPLSNSVYCFIYYLTPGLKTGNPRFVKTKKKAIAATAIFSVITDFSG